MMPALSAGSDAAHLPAAHLSPATLPAGALPAEALPDLAPVRLADAISRPVPPAIRRAALDAFDARVEGALILDLIYDSLLEVDPDAQSVAQHRQLRFSAGHREMWVDVAIEPPAANRMMTIWLIPAQRRTVQVRCAAGIVVYSSSDEGVLTVQVPSGPMSLVFVNDGEAGGNFQTAWVRG